MRIRGSIRTPVDDADVLGSGMDRTDPFGGSRSATLHGCPVRSPASQKIFARLNMPTLPPGEVAGRRQRTTVVNGPGRCEGRAETALERLAPGHGHLRFSASPSPRGPERRATGRRPAGQRQGGGQDPGVPGKSLCRNKEDLIEDQPTPLHAELDRMGTYGRQTPTGRQAEERLRSHHETTRRSRRKAHPHSFRRPGLLTPNI